VLNLPDRERDNQPADVPGDEFDVIIVGAGLSGIGAARYLQMHCPQKTFAILESRQAMGGTWDLFRYPGIRSDSDMYTLGYNFKPWLAAKSIADGPSILNYVQETAAENGIDRHIRYDHRLLKAKWSSPDATWTLEIGGADGARKTLRCNFLLMCSGYYDYENGYTPEFEHIDSFAGEVVHPQHWPQDLDYSGKKIVVIGSGATAVTLLPVLAEQAEHVTMLQRSPTYMTSWSDTDKIAHALRKVLPEKAAYAVTRWKNILVQQYIYHRSRTQPEKFKQWLLDRVRAELGPDYDIQRHFTPRYNPWDQRLCFVPNSDLFLALKAGTAEVVTDEIADFTATGIQLKSGQELVADIIVTATGLNPVILGKAEIVVDGHPVDIAKTFSYKGIMYSDVPNLASTFGYINASWTLRADLTAEFVCRLLQHMDQTVSRQCTPRLRSDERDMPARPWIDGFSAGYMQRLLPVYPRQGDREPWINPQNYRKDKKMIHRGAIDDGVLQFTR
jgi:cation diffusion facilitator CzcD-associated flavoprotein CzcO